MCLAVPALVVEAAGDEAVVDLQGNRLRISAVLTPRIAPGEWVLVHAGFAIGTVEERDALETWDYLRDMERAGVMSDAGADLTEAAPAISGGP